MEELLGEAEVSLRDRVARALSSAFDRSVIDGLVVGTAEKWGRLPADDGRTVLICHPGDREAVRVAIGEAWPDDRLIASTLATRDEYYVFRPPVVKGWERRYCA